MELSQQLAAVGIVLGFLAVCLVLAQRRGLVRFNLPVRSRALREMELIDRLALTPQHGLHGVRSGDRFLLIATHPRGVDLIETRGCSIDSASPKAIGLAAAGGDWRGKS
jgi:hypothetical protein